jgi:DNA repair protein RadC
LSDAEVLGLLLRTGGRESSALDIAEKLLAEVGGLNGLIGASSERLQPKGIGEAHSSVLVAALAERLARLRVPPRKPRSRPGLVTGYLALRSFVPYQEILGAIFLDVRHRLSSIPANPAAHFRPCAPSTGGSRAGALEPPHC